MNLFIKHHDNRNDTIVWRCMKRGCQTTSSVKKDNSFLSFVHGGIEKGKLPLSRILEIVYLWSYESLTQNNLIKMVGISSKTVVKWKYYCREICLKEFNSREKIGKSGNAIQIDESILITKRKSKKGRLMKGDMKRARYDDETDEEWIFGLVEKYDDNKIDARYFIVTNRNEETLTTIIRNEVEEGSEIHSDCWKSYSKLASMNYKHKRVNHSENFIDPRTKANTQLIEVMWKHLKLRIVQRMSGKSKEDVEGYLAERYYRMLHRNEDIFECFLKDISKL
jgi:hypothetical protein